MTSVEDRLSNPRRGICIDCKNNDTEHMKECNPYNMKMATCTDYASGYKELEMANQIECDRLMRMFTELSIKRSGDNL